MGRDRGSLKCKMLELEPIYTIYESMPLEHLYILSFSLAYPAEHKCLEIQRDKRKHLQRRRLPVQKFHSYLTQFLENLRSLHPKLELNSNGQILRTSLKMFEPLQILINYHHIHHLLLLYSSVFRSF